MNDKHPERLLCALSLKTLSLLLFHKHVALAQRIMDDIIDLELEKIERIIEKIDQDPENEEVKHTGTSSLTTLLIDLLSK